MKLKTSKYNLFVAKEQKSILLNTYSGSAIQLGNKELLKLKEILEEIDQFGETTREKQKIAKFLLEQGFLVPFNKDELKHVLNYYNDTRKDTSRLSLLITPTLKCNMKCHYCYQDRDNNNNLNINEDIDAIVRFADEKLESSGKLHINWFGGEPLYDKNFVYNASTALMNLANSRNAEYSASMVSNAYLLDDSTISELKKYKVKLIQITFDGSQDQHDKVRRHLNPVTNRREGSFFTIIKNIKNAATFFDIILRVNVTQYNLNSINTLIEELACEGLAEKGVQIYFSPVYSYNTTNANVDYTPNKKTHLTVQNFSELESQWLYSAKEKGFKIRDPFQFGTSGCSAVQKNSYVIESNGQVKKCTNEIGKPGTDFTSITSPENVDTHNLDIWENYQPEKECKSCAFLPICYSHCPHRNMYSPEEKPDKCPSFKYNWQNTLPLFLQQKRDLSV
ncbi:radical SAM protein (plasmid) [Bacillus thuringiensis]|nr:radical SAM protein [Bacillus thuringiensis]